MVFQRKSVRRFRPRRSRRTTGKFSRKSFKRHSRNMRPSTGKESAIMKDRTFVKFNYTAITQANNGIGDEAGNGYGMLAYNFESNPAMYVFSPNYSISDGAITNQMLLPGNSLQLSNNYTYYSDNFEQEMPTGVDKWSAFYDKYICHGSAIDVTLCDCEVAGQLVVLPITTNIIGTAIPGYVAVPGTASSPINFENLIQFSALPDEQPYRKIKFVSSTGGMDRVNIKHKMMTKKLYDVKSLRDDANNKATLGTTYDTLGSPTVNQWCWFVGYIPANTPSDTAGGLVCTVQIKITYFCELMDRNAITYVTANS